VTVGLTLNVGGERERRRGLGEVRLPKAEEIPRKKYGGVSSLEHLRLRLTMDKFGVRKKRVREAHKKYLKKDIQSHCPPPNAKKT